MEALGVTLSSPPPQFAFVEGVVTFVPLVDVSGEQGFEDLGVSVKHFGRARFAASHATTETLSQFCLRHGFLSPLAPPRWTCKRNLSELLPQQHHCHISRVVVIARHPFGEGGFAVAADVLSVVILVTRGTRNNSRAHQPEYGWNSEACEYAGREKKGGT